jgi:hypothetical protein
MDLQARPMAESGLGWICRLRTMRVNMGERAWARANRLWPWRIAGQALKLNYRGQEICVDAQQ